MKRQTTQFKRIGLIYSLLWLGLLLIPSIGQCFYNPNSGRWLSRDPIGERGGATVYGFIGNTPAAAIDPVGLVNYTIENVDPTGWWGLSLADVDVPGGLTFKGFHSRYLPSDGRNGHPPCPCKKENIFLAQAVKEPSYGGRLQFDLGKPGYLRPHSPADPIPGYYSEWQSPPPSGPLTIVDAPNSDAAKGTWEFEDCAVCRTHPDADSVLDKVLGCVKFKFRRINDHTAELSVEGGKFGPGGFAVAQTPGTLWKKALEDWKERGK